MWRSKTHSNYGISDKGEMISFTSLKVLTIKELKDGSKRVMPRDADGKSCSIDYDEFVRTWPERPARLLSPARPPPPARPPDRPRSRLRRSAAAAAAVAATAHPPADPRPARPLPSSIPALQVAECKK